MFHGLFLGKKWSHKASAVQILFYAWGPEGSWNLSPELPAMAMLYSIYMEILQLISTRSARSGDGPQINYFDWAVKSPTNRKDWS